MLDIVEIAILNSLLGNSCSLTIADPGCESITKAIEDLERFLGSILEEIDDIQHIVVWDGSNRITVIWIRMDGEEEAYVVRYEDHMLSARERRLFERVFREFYGISIYPWGSSS